MKKNRLVLFLSLFAALVLMLAACGGNNNNNNQSETPLTPQTPGEVTPPADTRVFVADGLYIGEDGNYRFENTRTISVTLWNRGADRFPDFEDSYWALWVQEQVLATHNIQVEWEVTPRWGEDDFTSTLMGASSAADVTVTFNGGIVETFGNMGGIVNLLPYLNEYNELLPNLYGHLGETLVYWNFNPQDNELLSLMGREAIHGRVVPFIREDWLAALDLPMPQSQDEFTETLLAFRDRYAELPGDLSADDVIPFFMTDDVMWDLGTLVESFIPSGITEREFYVLGWDDRRFHHEDAVYQALKIANYWYNEGLLWDDFLFAENAIGHERIRQGHVGAFIANWDMPFRAGDAWTLDMRSNIGPDATFIPAIDAFPTDNGSPQVFLPNEAQRHIFLPHTNTEVLASLLYIDFMSRVDVLEKLQLGVEGYHFNREASGALTFLVEDDNHSIPDWMHIPSARNFDITITANGFANVDNLVNSYAGIEPRLITLARNAGIDNGVRWAPVNVRPIEAQDGMSGLSEYRNDFTRQLVVAPVDQFPTLFRTLYDRYMDMGARAIIEERAQAWYEEFGAVDFQP